MRHLEKVLVVMFTTILVTSICGNSTPLISTLEQDGILTKEIVELSAGPITPYWLIEYEANFTDYGFTGSGTEGAPYTIEGLDFVHSGGPCIKIVNQSAYWKIVDCDFVTLGDGLEVRNSTNGHIEGSVFEVTQWAVELIDSNKTVIVDNEITSSSSGVYLQSCNEVNVSINRFSDSSYGMFLVSSTNCIFHDNNIENALYGIYESGLTSNHITITDNIIRDTSSGGIYIKSPNCTISNNRIEGSGGYGIRCSTSTDSLILSNNVSNVYMQGIYVTEGLHVNVTYNNVFNSEDNGIHVFESEVCIVTWNYVHSCEGYGISLDNTNSTLIHTNKVYLNDHGIYNGPISSSNRIYSNHLLFNDVENGYDNGGTGGDISVWDFSALGNQWSNAVVEPYAIPGPSGAVDNFASSFPGEVAAPIPNQPSDFSMDEDETDRIIHWVIDELFPVNYTLYVDYAIYDTGHMMNEYIFEIEAYSIEPGVKNFTVVFKDLYNNTASDTVLVTVNDVDYEPPTIIAGPTNETVQYQFTHNYQWNVTDEHPDSYLLYDNEIEIASGEWTSTTNISESVDFYPGPHNLTIWINDTYGHTVTDTVWIDVTDPISPLLSEPLDFSYEVGTSGHFCNWSVNEDNPVDAEMYLDDTVINTFSYSDWINYSVDGLSLGEHNFTVVVWDADMNYDFDTVIVTVVDTLAPSIESLDNLYIEYGALNPSVSFNMTPDDTWDTPGLFLVFVNGSQVVNGVFAGNIGTLIPFDRPIGIYNVTLYLEDQSGNGISATTWVIVGDSTNPTINSPENLEFIQGTEDMNITWQGDDLLPSRYTITVNDTVSASGDWIGQSIRFDVTDFEPGTYIVKLTLYDTSGNSISDSVIVTVLPPPDDSTLLVIGLAIGGIGAITIVVFILYYTGKLKRNK
ncbi:MAG: hypothetical protein GF411_19365 [Candidatus Lokiarchaeota archaeon]|nr:hypothetical protein [Candidatus Lokiarchaeota archaeon]